MAGDGGRWRGEETAGGGEENLAGDEGMVGGGEENLAGDEGMAGGGEENLAGDEGMAGGGEDGLAGDWRRWRGEGTAGGGEGGRVGMGGFGGSFDREGTDMLLAGMGGILGGDGGTAGTAGTVGSFNGFDGFDDLERVGNRGNVDCVPDRVLRSVPLVSPFPLSGRIQGSGGGDFWGGGEFLAGTGGSGESLAGDWAFPQRGCDFLRMDTKWFSCTISAFFSPMQYPSDFWNTQSLRQTVQLLVLLGQLLLQ